jgi:hypothetical protein
MFTSLPVPFFRELIFKTNLMKNQEKPFRISVWLIPTRQRFDNCLLKKFNYIRHSRTDNVKLEQNNCISF